MKKQNGFISSSSSVSIKYTTTFGPGNTSVQWSDVKLKNINASNPNEIGNYDITTGLTAGSADSKLTWKTFTSSSYHRIEYFLEAVEKMNAPFESKSLHYTPLTNFNKDVFRKNLYDAFVDVVITFPVEIRLAGIELFNPWLNNLTETETSNYWRYLPSKFSIFKVDNSKINDALERVSYENDIARNIEPDRSKRIRPIRHNFADNDSNLIFLGSYNVNWESTANYKCFFKYNKSDKASIVKDVNRGIQSDSLGTATWTFKQLVLRIYDTKINSDKKNRKRANNNDDFINDQIAEFIQANELKYGTTYFNKPPTKDECKKLIGYKVAKSFPKNISSTEKIIQNSENSAWDFKSNAVRSYVNSSDVKFECGIDYKLGGIQLLLSPDIFSVSEMKMYNYCNTRNNKVFIGEWNKDNNQLEYYGTGTKKRSPNIKISDMTTNTVSWKHNFNIPPKYLEADVYVKFNMDYGDFYNGDIVSNLVNINKEPITLKLTGTEVMINISNGICFTNPTTGEFMTFMGGVGIQMDRPGNFDAYAAALDVGANIVDFGSSVSTVIKGGYPFDLYFIVKRLF